ncbi:hypothetical protein [Bradyrhizobium sp. 141]|uniref:hypothetical protein n=1 Tax=Bradyrhizobium sp. 141 TaxID=2782617 RepID=UPI001FF9268E|nr:hypothetical protein [Bradyrhizobium sp. 141]MCK1718213.1 hypothetical protein [Bradyrhizobium sp. 141]
MAADDLPFSSTVSSVVDAFFKKLEDQKTLSSASLSALRKALADHQLDAESLRAAIFNTAEPSNDPD